MPEGVFAKLSPSFPLEEGLALRSVCLLPPSWRVPVHLGIFEGW